MLHNPNAVVPYLVSAYIAQKIHSARCFNAGCAPVGGKVCTPGRGQNLFGCDTHGTMVLHPITPRAGRRTPALAPVTNTPADAGPFA